MDKLTNPVRLLLLLAALMMSAGLVACDDDDGGTNPTDDMVSDAVDDTTDTTETDTTDTTDDDTSDMVDDGDVSMSNTIVDVANAAGDFTTLLAAAEAAGLADDLMGPGPFTVFAPTDEAFDQLLGELGVTAEELLADPRLETILSYHVVAGELDASQVGAADALESLTGIKLYIDASSGVVINGEATVTTADVTASNGVIHVIDAVLLPPDLTEVATLEGSFETLLTAATTAQLDGGGTVAEALADESTEYTLFAPTDAAFEQLLTDLGITAEELLADPTLTEILLYHTVDGEVLADEVITLDSAPSLTGIKLYIDASNGVVINDSVTVTATDVLASNGVIHVLDAVLLPPDLTEVAALEGGFETLLTAATTAEIEPGGATVADALADDAAEYTLFAPTDAAFEQLLTDLGITAEELLADPTLTEILLYHTVDGEVLADEVITLDSAPSLTGIKLYIDASNGVVINDTVTVTATDVLASNGVIHVLDAVLLPPDLTEVATFEGLDTLVAAVDAAGLTAALAAPDADLTVFAPSEQAFADLLAALGVTANDLLADPDLANILLYHVVSGTTLAADVVALDGAWLPTLFEQAPNPAMPSDNYGAPVIVAVDEGTGTVTINEATVTVTDIQASNGVVHVIDTVLVPRDAVEVAIDAGLTELAAVLTELNLVDAVTAPEGPYTIFAPNNQAWLDLYAASNGIASAADVPASAVLFHLNGQFLTADDVVAAGTLTMNDGSTLTVSVDAGTGEVTVGGSSTAVVETINVPASNAIIHVIDAVMLP